MSKQCIEIYSKVSGFRRESNHVIPVGSGSTTTEYTEIMIVDYTLPN